MYAKDLWEPYFVTEAAVCLYRLKKETRLKKVNKGDDYLVRTTQTHDTCIITTTNHSTLTHIYTKHESYVLATIFLNLGHRTACNTIWNSYFRTLPIYVYIRKRIYYDEQRLLRFLSQKMESLSRIMAG